MALTSERASERMPLLVSSLLFVASWVIARTVFGVDDHLSDVPLYRTYGEALIDGRVPYRDLAVEYPPAALPFFAFPAAVSHSIDGFRMALEAMLVTCGLVLLVAADAILRRLAAAPRDVYAVLGVTALSPLLLERVALERYDLWPVALVAVAVVAAIDGRYRIAGMLLGLGTAAKLYPAALVPFLVAAAWRARGSREGSAVALVAAGTFVVCVAPFVVLSPSGTADVLGRQFERPLQLETVGSALLLAAHQVVGLAVGVHYSYGSVNLGGTRASLVAGVFGLLLAACLVGTWLAAFRRPPDPAALVLLCAAAVAAIVAFGKVLSPQFLLWLLPLAPIAGGMTVAALLGGAMLLTNALFPDRYLALERLEAGPSWLLVARDALVVTLTVVLLRGVHRYVRQPPVSPL